MLETHVPTSTLGKYVSFHVLFNGATKHRKWALTPKLHNNIPKQANHVSVKTIENVQNIYKNIIYASSNVTGSFV